MRSPLLLVILLSTSLGVVSLLPSEAQAHQDQIPAPHEFQRVYELAGPLGTTRLQYTGRPGGEPIGLTLATDLFNAQVPGSALASLPRPDWQAMVLAYSNVSFDEETHGFVDRPYVYLRVPLFGPSGREVWEDTWVDLHFDHNGQLTRWLRVDVRRRGTTRTLREEWPLGSDVTAAELRETLRGSRQ